VPLPPVPPARPAGGLGRVVAHSPARLTADGSHCHTDTSRPQTPPALAFAGPFDGWVGRQGRPGTGTMGR